jgi:hypothetical protein
MVFSQFKKSGSPHKQEDAEETILGADRFCQSRAADAGPAQGSAAARCFRIYDAIIKEKSRVAAALWRSRIVLHEQKIENIFFCQATAENISVS